MEIQNGPLEFTSDDAALWRAFLRTQAGERLLPKLSESLPLLLGKGDTNEILIRNGEVRGYQAAVQNLLSLAFPQAEVQQRIGEYPALTDDKAWGDGQEIK